LFTPPISADSFRLSFEKKKHQNQSRALVEKENFPQNPSNNSTKKKV
jgi:hypothetical protein